MYFLTDSVIEKLKYIAPFCNVYSKIYHNHWRQIFHGFVKSEIWTKNLLYCNVEDQQLVYRRHVLATMEGHSFTQNAIHNRIQHIKQITNTLLRICLLTSQWFNVPSRSFSPATPIDIPLRGQLLGLLFHQQLVSCNWPNKWVNISGTNPSQEWHVVRSHIGNAT